MKITLKKYKNTLFSAPLRLCVKKEPALLPNLGLKPQKEFFCGLSVLQGDACAGAVDRAAGQKAAERATEERQRRLQ